MDMETQEIAPDLIAREDPSAATPLECMDGLDPLFNTKHTDGWKWDIPHSSVTSRGETEDVRLFSNSQTFESIVSLT